MEHDVCLINSLLPELREEILIRVHFMAVSALEITSKFWRREIIRKNLWKKIYQKLTIDENISTGGFPISYLWFINIKHAFGSMVLNTDQFKTIDDNVINSIRVPYKAYMQAIMAYKRFVKQDLEAIESRTDLTPEERLLASKIYWYLHKYQIFCNDSLLDNKIWTPELMRTVQDPYSHLAKKRPLLLWKERCINYATQRWEDFYLAVWTEDGTTPIMFYGMFNDESELKLHSLVSGTPQEISKNTLIDDMLRNPAFGSPSYAFDGGFHQYIWNKQVYSDMAKRYGDILEICAANVIESVKVSLFGSRNQNLFYAIKHYCDKWHQNSENLSYSKVAKVSIIRALRRVSRFLISEEISSQSIFTEVQTRTINRNDAHYTQYVKKRPKKDALEQDFSPKYWPVFLIEKSCFMAYPLSKILVELLESTTRPITDSEILEYKSHLSRLSVDLRRVDHVINEFGNIELYSGI